MRAGLRFFRPPVAAALLTAMVSGSIVGSGVSRVWTAEDRRAAASLNAEGDKAYARGAFSVAKRAYMDSYPNYPNVHAYLMTGDAEMRSLLAFHLPRVHTTPRGQCVVNNEHFADGLTLTLDNHYRRGLALAALDRSPSPRAATLYRRSREVATCLTALEAEYSARPTSACVDLAALSRCLGEPLEP